MDHRNERKDETPPKDFVKQVKDALEHLYDYSYLQRHPLAQASRKNIESTGIRIGQQLQRDLIAAIESLNPGTAVAFRAPHARLYNLLQLHYVEGITTKEAAYELGISDRQAYRDMRRGEENVAVLLWTHRRPDGASEPRATRLSSMQTEMSRLETNYQPVDVNELVQHALAAVERIAQQRHIRFETALLTQPVIISADPLMARQVLVMALSYVVQQVTSQTVILTLEPDEEGVALALCYGMEFGEGKTAVINPIIKQLNDRLGWTISEPNLPHNKRSLFLQMTQLSPTILVVDDNEGLVVLLERYLSDRACRVVTTSDGMEGLRLARGLPPDAIILDVMMPGIDGWELLQRLQLYPETASIPVIVCSVINDPELAFSLGAALFLPKPVSRDSILNGLRSLGVVS